MNFFNLKLLVVFSFIGLSLADEKEKRSLRIARQGPPQGGGPPQVVAIQPNYNYPNSTLAASSDPIVYSWIKSTGISAVYKAYTNVNKVQYSAQYVYVSCSSIPSYSIGPTWNSDTNIPSDQNFTFQFPRVPVPNNGNKTSVSLGNIGIFTNGVGMFNAEDGQTIMGWKRNAYFFELDTFDSCSGHPQQTGDYHHHVIPNCLFNSTDSSKHSPLIGFAFDGYPVYGPFGYSNASNPNSAIKRILSSYRLRSIATRSTC